jgi:transcriptional regulator with GAF, ATPase, and Fis domain
MALYESLFQLARLLLSEDGSEQTARLLLRRLLEAAGAERGFIVVREDGSFQQKFDVDFDRTSLPEPVQRFSRGLVRQAIASGELIYCRSLSEDPRFHALESVRWLGECSVLVAPLRATDDVWGVLYMEKRGGAGFDEEARLLLGEFAGVAGHFLQRTLEHEELRRRQRSLERDLFAQHDFEGIVTQHPRMLELLKVVAQVADSDSTVLIRGETGTGKELVARALHVNSARRRGPFVTLHCTALPSTILESELFGHVKGAFTGADRDRSGRIASAAGGTLLLDEVGEIPLELQAKLLRFLELGEIQRLGSDRTERVDVRILAATHRDLGARVQTGEFRQDLFFRLNVVPLEIPPLRERRGDIPLLARHFLRLHCRRPGAEPRLTGRAERVLLAHDWPGNVRELGHAVERACLLATGPELDLDVLPAELSAGAAPAEAGTFVEYTNEELKTAIRLAETAAKLEVERTFVTGLLQRCGGNVSQAARETGISRTHLQKLLARTRAGAEGPAPP